MWSDSLRLCCSPEVLVTTDHAMTVSGRFFKSGVTNSFQYDHISIVYTIADDMRHGEPATSPVKKIVGDVKKSFQFSSLRHNLGTDFHMFSADLSTAATTVVFCSD